MAVLGLPCCVQAFSRCREQGLLSRFGVRASHCGGFSCCRARTLGTWASVAGACGLSSCGAWTQLSHYMWDRPKPGIQPVSTTEPPGKPPEASWNGTVSVSRGTWSTTGSVCCV